MVGWPKLLRSMTARALVRRFSKDIVIAGTATTAAVLALSAVHDNATTGGPPRPPAEITHIITRNEPPATVKVAERAAPAAASARPVPARERSGPRRSSGPETPRPAMPGPRLDQAVRPAASSGAASSIEPPVVSPPLDLLAHVRTKSPPADASGERHWTFGSSLRLARSAAETATSRVFEWKQRITTSTGSLIDVLR